jgi:hypothetical protein
VRCLPLPGYSGTYSSLNHAPHTADKERVFLTDRRVYITDQQEFNRIPGHRFAFWASERLKSAFDRNQTIEGQSPVRQGFQTGNNASFVRLWHEVSHAKLMFDASSKEDVFSNGKKWVPYHKGGPFRKWYGNHDYVVGFDKASYSLLLKSGNCLPSRHLYFKEGITWSALTSSAFGARYSAPGFTFSAKGACAFPKEGWLEYVLALLNSKVAAAMLDVLAATLDFNVGSIRQIPLVDLEPACLNAVVSNVQALIAIARADWNSQETSWEFQSHFMLHRDAVVRTIAETHRESTRHCLQRIASGQRLETENNRLFIEAYGLQDELASEVPDDQITLCRPDRAEDIKRLLSYAIGCMMGRYSLDKPGLVYAHSGNQGFDSGQYRTFRADDDGIITLLETDWGVRDDATNRLVEFVGVTWPKEHLEENLKFIADSLGPSRDERPRDTIRRYLATGFFKDHLRWYKRRPIYWLFSSGKQRAFQALVYLHRYHEGTLARVRTEHVIPLLGKIAARIEQLEGDKTGATSTSHRRKLEKEQDTLKRQQAELQAYDEKLRHYADLRIKLDLDDGVKVNYGKFGDLLAEVKTVTGGSDE